MLRILAGGLSLIVALLLGGGAMGLLLGCILPWRNAPSTTHVTWIFAGMQFTGWMLLVPFAVLVILAGAIAVAGVCILKSQD